MHTGSIRQSGVRYRPGNIHGPVDPADNLLNHVLQLLRALKAFAPRLHTPLPFDEDMIRAVHHNLSHLTVIHQLLQHSQPAEGIKQAAAQVHPLF